MTDQLNSQLSAFIDDALSSEESDLLVRRLCRDEALRGTVARYTMIGNVVRDGELQAPPDFPDRVMRRLDGQPMPAPVTAETETSSNRPMMVAIAASVLVAAVALMTLPGQLSPPAEQETLVATDESVTPVFGLANLESAPAPAANYTVPTMVPVERQPAESRARLNEYLVQHLGATSARQGLVTYRNVGYVTEREAQ